MDGSEDFGMVKARVDILLHSQDMMRQEMQAGFLRLETTLGARLNQHSDRLGKLERWRAWIMGGVGFATMLWAGLLVWLKGARG